MRVQFPPLFPTSFESFVFISVRWGSEASKKHKTYLAQSAFLWCQFYETQLHVHRMIALKNLTDPERAAASMIICKNAARRCIEIVESANGVLAAPLCSYLLTVRSDLSKQYESSLKLFSRTQKSIFASSVFLLLMFWKKGRVDRDSPEYRAVEASKAILEKTLER